jgi:uncharacterized protein YpmB
MKRISKIIVAILILSVVPVSAATYTLVSSSYPITHQHNYGNKRTGFFPVLFL